MASSLNVIVEDAEAETRGSYFLVGQVEGVDLGESVVPCSSGSDGGEDRGACGVNTVKRSVSLPRLKVDFLTLDDNDDQDNDDVFVRASSLQ